jgi:peptidyl-prolyl cis-trans isomerase C
MSFMKKSKRTAVFLYKLRQAGLACALIVTLPVLAQTKDAGFTVNGSKIGPDVLEQLILRNTGNWSKDTPELREAVKNELIAMTVLSQDARKLNLDKSSVAQNQLQLARDGVLAELAIQKNAESLTITDAMVIAEYKRQLAALEEVEQYQVSNIVLQTEAEAMEVIKALKSGQSFEQLAKDKSIDNSRANGGNLGWVLPNQLIAPLASVIVNLTPGAVAVAPIATQAGWQVIKLQSKRKFQPPSLEESRPQLVRGLLASHRAEYVQKLVKAAKIESK